MVRFHKGEKYREKNYNERQIQMIEIVRASDKIAKLYKPKTINVESDIEDKINELINEEVEESAFKILEKHLNKNKDIINNK
ncbi:hypothetical protein Curi_c09760 [Gottschalkia acidurici 9a]|uniref:Uncharacterized protein n=2 Tax=Clostridium acidurici TaxID=1556 RepID=K0AYX4_GOTA9|nr:hypothetical protein Curi_c09760 [Gottschalkia acidurici 9a]